MIKDKVLVREVVKWVKNLKNCQNLKSQCKNDLKLNIKRLPKEGLMVKHNNVVMGKRAVLYFENKLIEY